MGNSTRRCNLERAYRCFAIFLCISLLLRTKTHANSDQLCDLVNTTKMIGSDEVIQCIDFAKHDGDTLDVSANVSAISTAGLSLCPLVDIDVMNCDIVYILDQSQSMPTKTVAYYTSPADTIFSSNGISRFNGPKDGDVEIPWGDSIKTVPYVINKLFMPPKNKPHRKPTWAGDPYGQSAIALHKTLDYQHAISPTSFAGFTGLHKFAAHKVAPAILNSNKLKNLKDSIFIDDYEGKTEFYPSLKEAKNWLLNNTICKNEKQMIIFISDGAPTDTIVKDQNSVKCKRYLQLLDEFHPGAEGVMPPIIGIFLGKEGATNYKPLQELADTTNGAFHIVPPDKPDSLVGVLKSIIESSFEAPPLDISFTNESIVPNQTSFVDKSKLIQQVDGSWIMKLDSAIALVPGYNDIRVEIKKTNKDGNKETLIHRVTLNSTDTTNDLDTLFEEECYDMASLELHNSEHNISETLTEKDTLCTLFMLHYDKHSMNTYQLLLQSIGTGDKETLIFQTKDTITTMLADRKKMKQPLLFHSNDTIISTQLNDTLETVAIDTIIAQWKNPRNSKDTLTDTFYVRGEEIIFKPLEAAIFDKDENGCADSIIISFNRELPRLFPIESAFWNNISSQTEKSSTTSSYIDKAKQICSFLGNQFHFGHTGISDTIANHELPKVVFKTESKYKFPLSEIVLNDRVGPIPVHAVLRRSHPLHGSYDTLLLTVSEILEKSSDKNNFKKFLRLVNPEDISSNEFEMYDSSQQLELHHAKTVNQSNDSLTYQFVIEKEHGIKRGSRLFLDRESILKDREGNRASRLSVPLYDLGVLFFTLENQSYPIDSLYPNVTPHVVGNFNGLSLTNEIDSVAMTINTETGEQEIYYLLETENESGIYRKLFIVNYTDTCNTQNDTLEAAFIDQFTDASCKSEAILQWHEGEIRDSLTLCYTGLPYIEKPKLFVQNRHNIISDTIQREDTLFTVLLDIYNKINVSTFNIKIRSAKHNDSEQLTLTRDDSLSNVDDTLRIVMAKSIKHHSSDIVAPVKSNGIVETTADDTLFLEWINPTNSAETAFDTVIVKGKSESISVISCTIKDLDEDGAGDVIDVIFDTLLPVHFTVDSAFWNEYAPQNLRKPGSCTLQNDHSLRYSFINTPFPTNLTKAEVSKAPNLFFTNEQQFPLSNLSPTIDDGVGPVPTEATLFASAPTDTEPDTLQITLSEPCLLRGTAFTDIIRKSSTTGSISEVYALSTLFENVEEISLSSDGTILTALLSQRSPQEYANISICIDTLSLADRYKNRVSRRAVPIHYRGKLFFTEQGTLIAKEEFNTNSIKKIDAHLYSVSITSDIDSILLSFSSSDGDIEECTLVESAKESGYFKTTQSINHVSSLLQNNSIIEGVYSSLYTNDTTACNVTFLHAGEKQQSSFWLTYVGADDFYVTNSIEIRTQTLTDQDSLFYINLNSNKATVSSTYTITVKTAEHGDLETVPLESSLHSSGKAVDPLRIVLSNAINFVSSDIIRPLKENGRIEASAQDTLFLSCTDYQKGNTLYDTIIITGQPIRFAPIETVILDTNENGIPDKLYTTYNHPIPEPFVYKALYWNNTSIAPVQFLTTVATTGATDTLTWSEQQTIATGIPETTGLNELPTLLLQEHDFLKFDTLQSVIKDGIGAVPLEAKLLCSHRGLPAPDTLIIVSSEPIQQPAGSLQSPVRSCKKSDITDPLSHISGYEVSVSVPSTAPFVQTLQNGILLYPPKNSPLLTKGNYIFLNRESGGTDLCGNQHSRKRVSVKRYEKLYFTLPEKPDSLITYAEWPNYKEVLAILPVESTNDALVESLTLILTLPTGDYEELSMIETTASSGLFTTLIPIQFSASPTINNGTVDGIYLNPNLNASDTLIAQTTTPDGVFSESRLALHYNAPPRIKRALYFPSAIETATPDTLCLLTNVPVLWPQHSQLSQEELFEYWDGLQNNSNSTTASLFKETLRGKDTIATILVPRENALTPNLDSIQFMAGCPLIQTPKGVTPIQTPYTVIEYGALPPIDVAVVPNPFFPGTTLLPEIFSHYVPNSSEAGIGFRIRSRIKFQNARYTIFDALNNIIISDIPLYLDESRTSIYGAWNGKNRSNRTVGDGAYMVLFTIIDIYGQVYEEQALIGVKESYIPKYTFPWND